MIEPVIRLQILNFFHVNLYWGLMVCMHMTLKTLRGGPPRPPTPHVSQVETFNLKIELFQIEWWRGASATIKPVLLEQVIPADDHPLGSGSEAV